MVESQTFLTIKKLVEDKDLLVSSHGYDELANDNILIRDVILTMGSAVVLEDYPEFGKGPAVLITAYRPDPSKWSNDFRRRV